VVSICYRRMVQFGAFNPFPPRWDTEMMTGEAYALFEFGLAIDSVLEPRRSSESSE